MRYRLNGFGVFAASWLAVVALVVSLAGCGGGGPGSVIGEPASSHNQGTVQGENFAWGEKGTHPGHPNPPVHGENFAWGEREPCGTGYHEECNTNPETGVETCDCVLNP